MTDLHIHSYYSADGTGSPDQLFKIFNKIGIKTFSLTEHNSISHIENCLTIASQYPEIRYIPGVELSATLPDQKQEIHFLCYFIHNSNRAWDHFLFKDMVQKINNCHLGNLNRFSDLASVSDKRLNYILCWLTNNKIIHPSVTPTIYHIKRFLRIKHPHLYVRLKYRMKEVINKLKENGDWMYFPSVNQLSNCAKELGFKWFLAHPWRYNWSSDILQKILYLSGIGMDGIETNYFQHTEKIEESQALAKKYGLLFSCGTDVHDIVNVDEREYVQMCKKIQIDHPNMDWLSPP